MPRTAGTFGAHQFVGSLFSSVPGKKAAAGRRVNSRSTSVSSTSIPPTTERTRSSASRGSRMW